jgi:hypothetical protein
MILKLIKNRYIYFLTLLTISSFSVNQVNAATIDDNIYDSYSMIIKVDGKILGKISDNFELTQYYSFKNKYLLDNEIRITNQIANIKNSNQYILLDNFLPHFGNPYIDFLKIIKNNLKVSKDSKGIRTFFDKKSTPTITLISKKNNNSYYPYKFVSSNKSINKKIINFFNINLKSFNKIEVSFIEDSVEKTELATLDRVNLIKEGKVVALSEEDIKRFLSDILYETNANVEKAGLSFITSVDLNNTLYKYKPIDYIDIKMKVVKESIELYSYSLDKYYCGSLFRYDYFIEQSSVVSGNC